MDVLSGFSGNVTPGHTALIEEFIEGSYFVDNFGPGIYELRSSVVELDGEAMPAGNELHCQDVAILEEGQTRCDLMDCGSGMECVDGECVPVDDGGNGNGNGGDPEPGINKKALLAGVALVTLVGWAVAGSD